MKLLGESYFVVAVVLLSFMGLAFGQKQASAWEALLKADPTVVDDPTVGWQERLILHALRPEQADSYFRKGADPRSLLLDSGQTLQEYLDAKMSPPAGVYIALSTPCTLFSSSLEPEGRYGIQVRSRDLQAQGGSATGCGIPAEATAVILQLQVEAYGGHAKLKLWAADGPEPAESVIENTEVVFPVQRETLVVTLSGTGSGEDLMLNSATVGLATGRAVGYFRPLRSGDDPTAGVSFYTEGDSNNFFGTDAGASNTSGFENAFFGGYAGASNTTGSANAFFGDNAGRENSEGAQNAFFGASAGKVNTTGAYNAFFGFAAGRNNNTGTQNAFFGANAGHINTTGTQNAFFGFNTGYSNSTGSNNAYFGHNAGNYSSQGSENAFFGASAGFHNTTGMQNAFFGAAAGVANSVEAHNTFIGWGTNLDPGSDPQNSPVTNATALGYRAQVNQSNSLVLGSIDGINGATASVNVGIGTPAPQRQLHLKGRNAVFRMDRDVDTAAFMLVRTNSSGSPLKTFVVGTNASPAGVGEFIINDLGQAVSGPGTRRMTITTSGEIQFTGMVHAPSFVQTSSLRFKENVETLRDATQVVARLRGVSFNWKKTGKPSLGLIAEEVAEVIPEVVAWEEDSREAAGVNYSALLAVLVEAIKDQQAEIEILQNRLSEVKELSTELRDLRSLLLSSAAADGTNETVGTGMASLKAE